MPKFFRPPIGSFVSSFSTGYSVAKERVALMNMIQKYQTIKNESADKNGNGFWLFSFVIVNSKNDLRKTLENLPYSIEDIKNHTNQPQALGPNELKQMQECHAQLAKAHDTVEAAEEVIKDMAGPASFGVFNR